MSVDISIVVPTAREESIVATTIDCVVSHLGGYQVEILVVDNTVNASLKTISARFASNEQIRYFHEPIAGLLSGRHRGMQEARGEILIFIDDDVTVGETWLRSIVDTFEDPNVHLVGGRCLPLYPIEPPAWIASHFATETPGGWICAWLSLIDQGDHVKETNPDFVFGLNFAIRKSTLLELGGFHPDCVPDHLQHLQGDGETGLTKKLAQSGLRAVYHPNSLVHHRIPASRLTSTYFCKRAFYQGVCDSYTQWRGKSFENSWNATGQFLMRAVTVVRDVIRHFNSTGSLGPAPDAESDPAAFGGWLQRVVQRSAAAGRMFHLEALRKQPTLIDWINRENYWDYALPNLAMDSDAIRTWALERCNVPLRW